jgi:hypothetical protein
VAQVVEHLPSKHKALSLNSRTIKKRNNELKVKVVCMVYNVMFDVRMH